MPSIEQIQALLDKSPGDVFLNFALAMELGRQGREEEALARFDQVLALDAGYCPALFQKGQLLLRMARIEEARGALRAGIEAAGRAGDAHAQSEMQGLLDTLV